MGLYFVSILIKRLSQVVMSPGTNAMVSPDVDEALERRAVAVVLVFAKGLVFTKI